MALSRSEVTTTTLVRLAEALGVSTCDLIEDVPDETQNPPKENGKP